MTAELNRINRLSRRRQIAKLIHVENRSFTEIAKIARSGNVAYFHSPVIGEVIYVVFGGAEAKDLRRAVDGGVYTLREIELVKRLVLAGAEFKHLYLINEVKKTFGAGVSRIKSAERTAFAKSGMDEGKPTGIGGKAIMRIGGTTT